MQDTIIKGTGNSRSIRIPPGSVTRYPTVQAMLQAMENGDFPIDLGPPNPAGVERMGTELNKANLLSDDTAALYPELPENPVPDDVFQAIKSDLLTTIHYKILNAIVTDGVNDVVFDLTGLTPFKKYCLFTKGCKGYSFHVAVVSQNSSKTTSFQAGSTSLYNASVFTVSAANSYSVMELYPIGSGETVQGIYVRGMDGNGGYAAASANRTSSSSDFILVFPGHHVSGATLKLCEEIEI